MLHKTRGVVFRFTKFGETSIIVTMFTDRFGIQSYMVNGVRSKSGKNKIALYQPLTLLDLVVYYREHANINRIKEIKCLYPYQTVQADVRKSALAMFITEVVNKAIKEESHAEELCSFLIDSLIILDTLDKPENFHLVFLIKLSRYLGFGAHHLDDITGPRITDGRVAVLLGNLIELDYQEPLPMSSEQRKEILELLIKFYADHIENLGEIKSIAVLRVVMH